jgi:nucleotide sugar dehydrogenase
MDNAVIIGKGMVGNATAHAFGIKKHFDIKGSNVTLKEAAENRYIFICLPTMVTNSRYHTRDIFDIIKQIAGYGKQNVFIVRSTVYPGFARSVMTRVGIRWVVSNPEFLTEDTWKEDIENPDIIVVGADTKSFLDDVWGIYKGRYKGAEIFKTDTVTAEMAKLVINGFYSTKVVFANQISDYAKNAKANYETIKNIMYARKWIGKNHLDVHHKGGRGAGGKCLPKDLEALREYSSLPLIHTVWGINKGYLMKGKKK